MPDLEGTIWKKYKDQGVLVYGLHPNEDPGQVDAFVKQTGIPFPVTPSQGTLSKFAFPPGVGYPYPRDIVIGKDLRVRSIKNSFNVAEMDSLVKKLLKEQ